MKFDLHGDADGEFWHYVDSQRGHYTHPAPEHACDDQYCREFGSCWETIRNLGCVALKSNGSRCTRPTQDGMGMCAFHLENVVEWAVSTRPKAFIHEFRKQEARYARNVFAQAVADDVAAENAAKISTRVYFMGINDEIVKIGYSKHVRSRFHSIRQGSSLIPDGYDRKAIELLGETPGGPTLESRLHGLLAPWRLRGEWFEMSREVTAVVSFLALGEMEREATAVFRNAIDRRWWHDEGYATEWEAIEAMGESA